MALLSDADRLAAHIEFMRACSADRSNLEVTKANLRLAFDALDAWFEANKTSANTAIPQPARSALTTQQKVRLMVAVLQQRYLKGVQV